MSFSGTVATAENGFSPILLHLYTKIETPPIPSAVLMPIPAYSEKISSIFQSSNMGGESLEEMIISPQNPEMELCFNRYVLR